MWAYFLAPLAIICLWIGGVLCAFIAAENMWAGAKGEDIYANPARQRRQRFFAGVLIISSLVFGYLAWVLP